MSVNCAADTVYPARRTKNVLNVTTPFAGKIASVSVVEELVIFSLFFYILFLDRVLPWPFGTECLTYVFPRTKSRCVCYAGSQRSCTKRSNTDDR